MRLHIICIMIWKSIWLSCIHVLNMRDSAWCLWGLQYWKFRMFFVCVPQDLQQCWCQTHGKKTHCVLFLVCFGRKKRCSKMFYVCCPWPEMKREIHWTSAGEKQQSQGLNCANNYGLSLHAKWCISWLVVIRNSVPHTRWFFNGQFCPKEKKGLGYVGCWNGRCPLRGRTLAATAWWCLYCTLECPN